MQQLNDCQNFRNDHKKAIPSLNSRHLGIDEEQLLVENCSVTTIEDHTLKNSKETPLFIRYQSYFSYCRLILK